MNIDILAIGKAKRDPAQELFATYLKRLDWRVDLYEMVAKSHQIGEEHDLLCQMLDKKATPQSIIIALDERGKNIGSEELSDKFQGWMNDGKSHAVILIGGADGLSDDLRKRADFLLSFGKLTWPHMMVRAMLAEQLYRTHQIIAGHPYHRS